MATLRESALASTEERSSECAELRPAEPQPAPELRVVRNSRRRDSQLDRISSRICERAVKVQLGELPRLVRLSMAREFRPKLADLREQIKTDILSLSVE